MPPTWKVCPYLYIMHVYHVFEDAADHTPGGLYQSVGYSRSWSIRYHFNEYIYNSYLQFLCRDGFCSSFQRGFHNKPKIIETNQIFVKVLYERSVALTVSFLSQSQQ